MKIAWYMKRLRVMTARELLYRIRQQITLVSLRVQYAFGVGVASLPVDDVCSNFCAGTQARLPKLKLDLVALKKASTSLLKGEISIAGGTWRWEDSIDIWHLAPDTARIWPRSFFGNISYRDGNSYGDIRQLWEPSRLQQLVNLAVLADTCNGRERTQAIQMIKSQLASWVESNPPLAGAHYTSAMECALRMIAVCHALDLIRVDVKDNAPWRALLQIIGSHAPLIERRLSLYSSTGNHTVAEAAGLVYAGLLFPEMKGAQRWLATGMSILTDAAETQILPDGGGIEQAHWYHLFNIQLLSLVDALLKHHGEPVGKQLSEAVDRGSRFLEAMGLDVGWLPPIGDADGGHALSEYLPLAVSADEPTRAARIYRDSGYTVAHISSEDAVKLVFDHGPLGMPPSYGHGHADALSLMLRSGDQDVFVDPGTYTYAGDQDWRRYFRGTPAHNTVTVDGKDQANQDGCFLWSKPFRARLIASNFHENNGQLVAEHDGYQDLGVQHVRGIGWVRDQWLFVWDRLSGTGVHELDLFWHLATPPTWTDTETFDLQLAAGTMTVRCEGGAISSHSGERSRIAGWRSPSYGTIRPITSLRMYYHGPLPHTFTTLIRLAGSHPPEKALEDALHWIKNQSQ